MSDSTSLVRSVLPFLVLAFLLARWLAPPDPFTQTAWFGAGVVVAAVLGLWFARTGHRRLGATPGQLWLFVACALGAVVLGTLLVPDPTFDSGRTGAIVSVAVVIPAWLAFADGAGRIRRGLSGGNE